MCPAVLWEAQASWGSTVWEQLPSGACGTQAPGSEAPRDLPATCEGQMGGPRMF